MNHPYAWIDPSLQTIHRANWYRSPKTISSPPGPIVTIAGQEVINFASNDYLGLAADERLKIAAINAIQQFGTGSTGSRLLSGHRQLHTELEQAIASLKQTQDAIVFSSGYLANLGTISAIVGKRDLILSDEYNHSSLKKGAILSGGTIKEYPHNNTDSLKTILQHHRNHHRRCLIITDSVFSMDGDLCPLLELIDLAEEFNCMLLVDEAHATGIFGSSGAGTVEHFNCTGREIIQVGTLSKALGSLGGYVAGSAQLIDFLRNRASTWIYTTALSPADTAAALTAINMVKNEPERRQKLWRNVTYLQELITDSIKNKGVKLEIIPSESPIICFTLPNPNTALKISQQLKTAGIFAPAIRPPTVPTSRIRISLMATHEISHIQRLVELMQTWE